MIWLPSQLVNFSVVPRHLRVPFAALVSFGWTTVLSVMQSNFDSEKQGTAGQRIDSSV